MSSAVIFFSIHAIKQSCALSTDVGDQTAFVFTASTLHSVTDEQNRFRIAAIFPRKNREIIKNEFRRFL